MFCFPTLSWNSQVTPPLPAPRNSEKSVPLACTPCRIVPPPPLRFIGQSMCPYGTLRLRSTSRCADCPFGLRPTDRPVALTTVNRLCNLSPCHPTGDKTPWGCALHATVNKLCKMLWWWSCAPCEQIVQYALVLPAACLPVLPVPCAACSLCCLSSCAACLPVLPVKPWE